MESQNKYFETGSNPYYVNLNNTAKELTYVENTLPQHGILNTLDEFILIQEEYEIEQPSIVIDYVIE
jgi:hypothetical protein